MRLPGCVTTASASLPWACALLQSPPDPKPPSVSPDRCKQLSFLPSDSSHEVFRPFSVSPHEAAAHSAGVASPHHIRPQVFSTSRRFSPPRACRPCFMPDPLMGLYPSEPCSLRVAARRLRRRSPPDVSTHPGTPPSSINKDRDRRVQGAPSPSGVCSPRRSALLPAEG